MTFEQDKKVIVEECLEPDGFAFLIRENQVDKGKFWRLLEAIKAISQTADSNDRIDRLTIACLFELPWEIENTVDHYSKQSKELGATVSTMAEELRKAINELLWNGLEAHYDIPNRK